MPLSFSEEGERLKDRSPCADLRARLKMCLLDSDCCKKVSYFGNIYNDLLEKFIDFKYLGKNITT